MLHSDWGSWLAMAPIDTIVKIKGGRGDCDSHSCDCDQDQSNSYHYLGVVKSILYTLGVAQTVKQCSGSYLQYHWQSRGVVKLLHKLAREWMVGQALT